MTTPVSFEKALKVKGGSLETGTARRGFLVNVSSNAIFIAAQAIVTLWMTPFLISQLGIAAYGMIPLATTVTSYMAIFITAVNSAVSRFLAIDLGQGDKVAANKTFNTALFGLIGIIVALVPAVAATSMAFPAIFKVPSGWERDASWLFAIVASAFFVTVIGGIFGLSPFVYSRFLLSNIVNLAGLLARLGITVVLFTAFQAHLWYAGWGILTGASVSLVGYLILWRKLTPELHIQISGFDRSRLRSLTAMGVWVVVTMVGATLLSRVDLIVVNAYFGPAVTGGYGSVVLFALMLEYLVNGAGTVVRPVMLIKYAQQDLLGLQRLSRQSTKLMGLVLALPVGLLCGLSGPILSAWLGPAYQYLSSLLIIIVFPLSLSLPVLLLVFVQNAYNKVRWPGIATLLFGAASVGLAVLMATWGKCGVIGVALAVAMVGAARNALYMSIYTAHIMGLPWWTFLLSLCPGLLGTLCVGIGAYSLALVRMPSSWFALAGFAVVISVLYAGGVWTIGMSHADKQLVKELLPGRILKT
jgi:O-antigen/teichoic acid export membrane protein